MARKLMYLLFAIALIVGLVPTTVLAAQGGVTLAPAPLTNVAYNIMGAEETFSLPANVDAVGTTWQLEAADGLTAFTKVAGGLTNDSYVTVSSTNVGALNVKAITLSNGTFQGEKKWGEISSTMLRGNGSTELTWNEYWKSWTGVGNVTETVTGRFKFDWGSQPTWDFHPADGAIVYFYLFNSSLDVAGRGLNRLAWGQTLKAELDALLPFYGAKHVEFTTGSSVGVSAAYANVSRWTTSGDLAAGTTGIRFAADGQESVRIIALTLYPSNPPQYLVRPEFTSWNFWTQETEKVPQVKWAGEKIVLEKFWGMDFANEDPEDGFWVVHYALEQESPGTLEATGDALYNLTNDATSVWTDIDNVTGVSQVILTSEKPGECDVTCSLYWFENGQDGPESDWGQLYNQHGFVVFFLKMESMTLSIVDGDRTLHNDGPWAPSNPFIADAIGGRDEAGWGKVGSDLLDDTKNVSADSLLRVRVNGWFVGDDLSIRDSAYCDVNASGTRDMADYILPAGRWVLPDDWEYLAGSQWDEFRPNWDMMNDPSTLTVLGTTDLGPYYRGTTLVAGSLPLWPVIGPYSSIDDGLPGGRPLPFGSKTFDSTKWTSETYRDTIVPDSVLNWTDCPMPAAKVTFEVMAGPGYFRAADKGGIYYVVNNKVTYYTNPFYATEIAASPEIPAVINNGGYDWDSWGWTVWDEANGLFVPNGAYNFWDIVNSLPNVFAPSNGTHPTKVQVYSDNHGEAMVYLNGDWNLDFGPEDYNLSTGGLDVDYLEEVGTTTVQAFADYPYLRKHPAISSNDVMETWLWGKDIIVLVEQMKAGGVPDQENKRIWVLTSDRDAQPVYGETIVWKITNSVGIIQTGAASLRYGYADTLAVFGWVESGDQRIATTKTYNPTLVEIYSFLLEDYVTEAEYIENLFGLEVGHLYGVSWVIVESGPATSVQLKILLDETVRAYGEEGEGWLERWAVSANNTTGSLDFSYTGGAGEDPADPIEYLTSGWNLVSFKSSNQSIVAALETIASDVVSVWAFDNTSKSWQAYSPTAPAWANNLIMMNTATPYWIEVNTSVTWVY